MPKKADADIITVTLNSFEYDVILKILTKISDKEIKRLKIDDTDFDLTYQAIKDVKRKRKRK